MTGYLLSFLILVIPASFAVDRAGLGPWLGTLAEIIVAGAAAFLVNPLRIQANLPYLKKTISDLSGARGQHDV